MKLLLSHGEYLRPGLLTHSSTEDLHSFVPVPWSPHPARTIVHYSAWCFWDHDYRVNVNKILCENPLPFISNQRAFFSYLFRTKVNRRTPVLSLSVHQTYIFCVTLKGGGIWSVPDLYGCPISAPLDLYGSPILHKGIKTDAQSLLGFGGNCQG